MLLNGVSHLDIYENICRNSIRQKTLGFCFPTPPIAYGSTKITDLNAVMYVSYNIASLFSSFLEKKGEKNY
jgi:hypothetical protein